MLSTWSNLFISVDDPDVPEHDWKRGLSSLALLSTNRSNNSTTTSENCSKKDARLVANMKHITRWSKALNGDTSTPLFQHHSFDPNFLKRRWKDGLHWEQCSTKWPKRTPT
jgi:hypothetical protein